MKNIDELQVKISGRVSFEHKLTLGDDVSLKVIGTICKEETYDNHDGSVSICYVVKPLIIQENEQH